MLKKVLRLFLERIYVYVFPFMVRYMPEKICTLVNFISGSKILPSGKNRLDLNSDLFDDFLVMYDGDEMMKEVNLIFRGQVTDKVDKNIPTFFLNPSSELRADGYIDPYYITADGGVLAAYLSAEDGRKGYARELPRDRVLFVHTNMMLDKKVMQNKKLLQEDAFLNGREILRKDIEKHWGGVDVDIKKRFIVWHKSGIQINMGSGLASIIAIISVSEKVNIYGWDQYLDGDMNRNTVVPSMIWPGKNWKKKINAFVIGLVCWVYAYRILNECPSSKVTVSGNVRGLKNVAWIKDNLFQIFYFRLFVV